MNCVKCNKPLSQEVSVSRGMGPVCAQKKQVEDAKLEAERGDCYDLEFDNATRDIKCERKVVKTADGGENQTLHFNISPLVTHHSPTGWEWGYAGSGPADFALNVVEFFCRASGEKPSVKLRDYNKNATVKICKTTQRVYQDFKFAFVTTLAKEGGTIRGSDIEAFIKQRREELAIRVN